MRWAVGHVILDAPMTGKALVSKSLGKPQTRTPGTQKSPEAESHVPCLPAAIHRLQEPGGYGTEAEVTDHCLCQAVRTLYHLTLLDQESLE